MAPQFLLSGPTIAKSFAGPSGPGRTVTLTFTLTNPNAFAALTGRVDALYIAGDPRVWSVGAAEHREIYEAAERRDANGASEATAQHLARTALTVLANLAPEHDPSLVRGALRASLAPDQPAKR